MKFDVRLAVTLTACVCSLTFCGNVGPILSRCQAEIDETPKKIGWPHVENVKR
jgi:hypothetical protein